MKNKQRITLLTVLLSTLLLSQTLSGQEQKDEDFKFGLGVTFFNILDYAFEDGPLNTFNLIMDFNEKFRLEPSVGFILAEGDLQYTFSMGAFYKKSISDFCLLTGIEFGVRNTDILEFAPTIGGEYYFIDNFSIGAEVQVSGMIIDGSTGLLTKSSLLVRFYF